MSASAVVYSVACTTRPVTNAAAGVWSCDGTTDQVEIQAAVDAVAAQGGGAVQLVGSRFNTSAPIRLRTGVYLRGEGQGTRIVSAANTLTGMVMLYDNTTHATTLTDLTLDGNGTQVHGVHYIANGGQLFSTPEPNMGPDPSHTIERLYVKACGNATFAGTGLLLQGGNLRAGKYSTMRLFGNSGNGVWLNGAVDSHFTNIEVGGSGGTGPAPSSTSTAPVGHGFYVGAGDNCVFTACKSWFSRYAGFYSAATRVGYVNCQAQDNYGNGFEFVYGKASAVGCHADSNGQGLDATRGTSGFRVAASNVALTGCLSYDRGGQAWAQQSGFSFTSWFSQGRVTGCVTYGNAVASVSGAAGAGTTIDVATDANGK